jgi:phage pi2 protein 07
MGNSNSTTPWQKIDIPTASEHTIEYKDAQAKKKLQKELAKKQLAERVSSECAGYLKYPGNHPEKYYNKTVRCDYLITKEFMEHLKNKGYFLSQEYDCSNYIVSTRELTKEETVKSTRNTYSHYM